MRKRIVLCVSSIVLTVLASCSPAKDAAAKADAATPSAQRADDEAALRAMYQKLPDMVAAADGAAIGAMFADDGVEVMAGMPPAKGPADAAKVVTASFSSLKNLKLTLGEIAVHVAASGDLAVVAAPYQMTGSDPKGKAITDHGTTMTVFKKVNGQWKILYDTNISEVPPPQG